MNECFKCEVSGDKALLFDAISDTGIIKICRKCSFEEDIPIIRKPTNFQLKESEKKQTVYDRLSHAAGLSKEREVDNKELTNQETTLKDLVEENFKSRVKKTPKKDLIDNFHWTIMRTRRSKKITQEQLAKAIAEPESAIHMAEKGILPEDYHTLIVKLENYLEIKLLKENTLIKREIPKEISFDAEATKALTISDLSEIKKEREEEILGEDIDEDKIFNEDVIGMEKNTGFIEKKDKDDLTQEEIDDLIFGRK